MKTVSFFTVHQAPHNTFTFKCLEEQYIINAIYLHERLADYGWNSDSFYYPGKINPSLYTYIKIAVNSDIIIISGWHSYKYLILIMILSVLRKRFGIYLDLDPDSLKRFGGLKKALLKRVPFIFITGIYGEKLLKRYLKRNNIYNFPYGVIKTDLNLVNDINNRRKLCIQNGDKIKVFISNRFIHRKGYHLVRSLLIHLKEISCLEKFQFTIVGDGPLYNEEKLALFNIDNTIKFYRWVEYSLYKELMSETDVLLHCSKFEPYGIPPVDAFLLHKTIVVSSRVYSLHDIIELGGRVLVFRYKDEGGLQHIFRSICLNTDKLYDSDHKVKIVQNHPYLFCDQHLNAINRVLTEL